MYRLIHGLLCKQCTIVTLYSIVTPCITIKPFYRVITSITQRFSTTACTTASQYTTVILRSTDTTHHYNNSHHYNIMHHCITATSTNETPCTYVKHAPLKHHTLLYHQMTPTHHATIKYHANKLMVSTTVSPCGTATLCPNP